MDRRKFLQSTGLGIAAVAASNIPAAAKPRFSSDSAMIQASIDEAGEKGIRELTIPRINVRTGEPMYNITETILIPENFTLYLDDCHLRMADGVICRMFQNSNALTEKACTSEGTQHNIHIIGKGMAVLDGGEPNGLNEFTSETNGFPGIRENLTIYLHNVEDFSIENITIVNQRWWAIDMLGCAFGLLENIHFMLTRHSIDSRETWRNQDGIDLRIGCHDITIRDIYGETGDDLIALTGLPSGHDGTYRVKDKPIDIHDVVIENVRGITSMCSLVRLLNHGRCKLYNININNLREISRPGIESKSQMAIRIIDDEQAYYKTPEGKVRHGEIFNIHIENVYTRALSAIQTCVTMKNMTVRNLHLQGDGQHAWVVANSGINTPITIYAPELEEKIRKTKVVVDMNKSTKLENVVFENVYDSAECTVEGYQPSLFRFVNTDAKNVVIKNVISSRPNIIQFEGTCTGDVISVEPLS